MPSPDDPTRSCARARETRGYQPMCYNNHMKCERERNASAAQVRNNPRDPLGASRSAAAPLT